jgi:hypothetical protein
MERGQHPRLGKTGHFSNQIRPPGLKQASRTIALARCASPELFFDSSKLDFRGWFCKLVSHRRGDLVGQSTSLI